MSVTTAEAAVETVQRKLREAGVKYAMSSFVDLHGNIKTKFVPLSHLPQMAAGSELFTGAALDGLPQDISDEELSARPDLDSAVQLPWRKEVAYFSSDLYHEGKPFEAASRNILKR